MSLLQWLGGFFQPSPLKPPRYTNDSDWASEHFPPDQREIAVRVARILIKYLNIRLDDLSTTTRFIQDLQMDDLEPMDIVAALERDFQFSIPVQDTSNLETMSDLILYLQVRVRMSGA